MTELGLIQVYTGNGKGKTTASLGLAFRASGHGFKICMIQFMKYNTDYGEVKAKDFFPGFTLLQVGRPGFVDLKNPQEIDRELARKGWEKAREAILSREYDIVILDEINAILACGLLETQEVADFLTTLADNRTELILTGRYAPPQIIALADLVTEMKEIKHPCSQGVPARAGIDF